MSITLYYAHVYTKVTTPDKHFPHGSEEAGAERGGSDNDDETSGQTHTQDIHLRQQHMGRIALLGTCKRGQNYNRNYE